MPAGAGRRVDLTQRSGGGRGGAELGASKWLPGPLPVHLDLLDGQQAVGVGIGALELAAVRVARLLGANRRDGALVSAVRVRPRHRSTGGRRLERLLLGFRASRLSRWSSMLPPSAPSSAPPITAPAMAAPPPAAAAIKPPKAAPPSEPSMDVLPTRRPALLGRLDERRAARPSGRLPRPMATRRPPIHGVIARLIG